MPATKATSRRPATASPTPLRSVIVEAADALFDRRGYAQTSFADIAQAVGISRGNFYYHFKTKDEILDAVIAARIERTHGMLAQWRDDAASPLEALRAFVHLVWRNRAEIQRRGCPVGTLTAEMAKLGHPAHAEAARLFTLFRQWLRLQFEALGAGARADALAVQLLVWSQGVATLASALGDAALLRAEVERIDQWLDEQAQLPSVPAQTRPRRSPQPRRKGLA